MKVVFCIDHLRPDGTQRFLQQIVAGLAARGNAIAILCLNESFDPVLVQNLRASGAEIRVAGKRAMAMGFGLWSIQRWLRNEQFDVAVTLLFASDVIGRWLAHASGIPYIISSLRARNADYAVWQKMLARFTMRWVDTVVINSRSVREYATREEGVALARVVFIPNSVCVEPESEPAERTQIRVELGFTESDCVVGSVGRLERQKGYDLLLESLGIMRQSNTHLVISGTGAEEMRLRQRACALGLETQLHLLGYRRDARRLLGALDVYVQPSRFEGMPNALLEAMATGLPVVASAVDGNEELINSKQVGWLVPPDDAETLAHAIACALSDRDEARRRGVAARLRVQEQFSVNAMVTAWERILGQL